VYKSENRESFSGRWKTKDHHKVKDKSAKGYKKQDTDNMRAGPTCYSYSGKGPMSKECTSKMHDKKGQGKAIKKKLRSDNVEYEQDSKVYIQATKIESYTTAQTTRPANLKAYGSVQGTIYRTRKEAKLLFNIGMMGANFIRTPFVITHGIPCIVMAKPTKVPMAIKG